MLTNSELRRTKKCFSRVRIFDPITNTLSATAVEQGDDDGNKAENKQRRK